MSEIADECDGLRTLGRPLLWRLVLEIGGLYFVTNAAARIVWGAVHRSVVSAHDPDPCSILLGAVLALGLRRQWSAWVLAALGFGIPAAWVAYVYHSAGLAPVPMGWTDALVQENMRGVLRHWCTIVLPGAITATGWALYRCLRVLDASPQTPQSAGLDHP